MKAVADDRSLPVGREDDEGLFSRDMNGQLVRIDAPTEGDYTKQVTLQIDGQPVTVPLASPMTDAQGNVVLDRDGRTTPRYTTIYDAASTLRDLKNPSGKIPIPVLCHQPHMKPVAVCRVCVVQVYGMRRGKRSAERKLLPACQHQVKDGMEVFTMNDPGEDGKRVRRSVNMMTELLIADHLKPAPDAELGKALAPFNELGHMAELCGLSSSRFANDLMATQRKGPTLQMPTDPRGVDTSSPVFVVDHSACILCDRCSRGCDDVKKNNVIGRTGKGAKAAIGFDLNVPMGESSCVQCGECMVSCPTSAITFNTIRKVAISAEGHQSEILPAAELLKDPLFADVPPKLLLWQQGVVRRRLVKKGEFLCRQGDPGNIAYVIKSGRLKLTVWPTPTSPTNGLHQVRIKAGNRARPAMEKFVTAADLIVGEMSSVSGTPRTADIEVVEDGEIWEVRRNIIDRVMRSPGQRKRFEELYRSHALDDTLRSSELFHGLPEADYDRCIKFLRPRLKFMHISPRQIIFEQGDWADEMYLIRLGHVRVDIGQTGDSGKLVHLSPGALFGEIGLLALSPDDAVRSVEDVDAVLASALDCKPEQLTGNLPAGQRTATCSSMDDVELARVSRADFLELVQQFPPLRRRLVEMSLDRMRQAFDSDHPARRQYIEQGLFEGQNILALDLDTCTRCDECTKACVDQHGTQSHGLPITRMLREGLRFGNFLVATSCRSCKDAPCLTGCPVDSIHRGRHQQIVIEDHCIGCGLCASNCPYGNIWILPDEKHEMTMVDWHDPSKTVKVARLKAATCDLCDSAGVEEQPKPRCVNACPHDAAHRMTGEQLLARVTGGI